MVRLYDWQSEAVEKMKNGCILCGDVGSGKSITSLAYYFKKNGGVLGKESYMDDPLDLYIITTAHKRDTLEWESELAPFLLSTDPNLNYYKNKVVIDSWNNISKYTKVKDAFFIFDEQRVVGKGSWVNSFIKISKDNMWVLLSATPGDVWKDYIPVFIANGFYRNRTEFEREHVVYKRFSKFPQIDRYLNTGKLIKYRNDILIKMNYVHKVNKKVRLITVPYDKETYRKVVSSRFNVYTGKPIKNASEYCSVLRKIVNSSDNKRLALIDILKEHPKAIVFYNYDYELDILKETLSMYRIKFKEWNGHNHEAIPKTKSWVYLVQYTAGAEGWNCITTDTVIFYSQNYSYKIMVQSAGRIDRMNTPFDILYYYHLKTDSGIDKAVSHALNSKKKFNESAYYNANTKGAK